MDSVFWLYYVLLGAFVGFVAGLVGVGGGGIAVPIFTLMFASQGIADDEVVHMALGTSMASMVFTTFRSMNAHQRQGNLSMLHVSRMSVGTVIGTMLATAVASHVNGSVLATFFSLFMLYVTFSMFVSQDNSANEKVHNALGNVMAGLGIGAVSSLVSVSGAGMTVPYLVRQNLSIQRAIGSAAAIGFPLTVAGVLGYLLNGWHNTDIDKLTVGYIYLPAFLFFSVGAWIVTPLGVKLGAYLPSRVLKKMIGVLALLLSVKMLLSVVDGIAW